MILGAVPVWVTAPVLLLYWVQWFCLSVAGWARLLSEMDCPPRRLHYRASKQKGKTLLLL